MKISRLTDLVYSFRLLNLVQKDWVEQEAYKLGLIDDKGNSLKKWDDMSSDEKDSMTYFVRIAFKLKKIIEKIPGGDSKIGKIIIGLNMLKEENSKLDRPFTDAELAFIAEELSKMMGEDTPVNVTGVAVSTTIEKPINKKNPIIKRPSLDDEK